MKKQNVKFVATALSVGIVMGGVFTSGGFAAAKATTKAPIVITYASWGDPKIVGPEIKAFEATHPGIIVKWDKSITWDWDQHLAAAAAAGKFPDVTWVFNVPGDVANGWLADLTPLLKKDPTYNSKLIFGGLASTANYYGHQFAMPFGLYAEGIAINKNLFEQDNIPLPKANWTLSEFERDAVKLTNYNQHQFGIENVRSMRETMISQFNPALGWLTWNGDKYNFTNPAWFQSVDLVNSLLYQQKVSPDLYNTAFWNKWYGKNQDPFNLGKIGMKYEYSWDFPAYAQLPFKWDFLPLPKVKGQRIPLVTDYMGVSRTSKHKQAAFEFLRWMTYSKAGWTWKMTHENPVSSMPLINDATVWNDYLRQKYIPSGMKDLLPMIPNAFMDGYKWLPGYPNVLNNIVGPEYVKFESGAARPQDLAANFETRANASTAQAMAAIKSAIVKFYLK